MSTFGFEPSMIDYRTVVVTVILLACALIAAVAIEIRSRLHPPGAAAALPLVESPTVAEVPTADDDPPVIINAKKISHTSSRV
jgi:CBS-domain-containing membrane protein